MNANSNLPDVGKSVRLSLLKSFIVPFLVLAFFTAAPYWLDSKTRSQIVDSINKNEKLSPAQRAERTDRISRMDFQKIAGDDYPEGAGKLHDALLRAGISGNFQRLRWGLILSWVLIAWVILSILAINLLKRKAGMSRNDLIAAYRTSWKIVIAAALVKVFLLIPLLAYGTFEFTVLLSNEYFPKLLFIIVVGGVIALWKSASVLLKSVPLEFAEPMARELTPEDAPEFWRAVCLAAERLHTAPPDRILIGLQLNFYVTELAVNYDGGRTEGKTLFLSLPLMKLLSENEVMAIIGHELGHFIGEDTRMTREFYPLRFKVRATMLAMARSSFVAWPSIQLLNYFGWCFGETERKSSRERELLADQKAAALTSAQIAAGALIRFTVAVEAFQRGLKQLASRSAQNILDLPLHSIIREKLAPEQAFWAQLFEKNLPHPLDSHPSLRVRLEALGQPVDVVQAQAIALANPPSAEALWFAKHSGPFAALAKHAEVVGEKLKVAHADYQTDEGRQLLEKYFPERKWKTKSTMTLAIVLGFIALALLSVTIFADDNAVKAVTGALAIALMIGDFLLWKHPHNSVLTLNAEGVHLTGWLRPVLFKDVANITGLRQYGIITLTFHFKGKQPPFKKSLFRYSRKRLSLGLSSRFRDKPVNITQSILTYFKRVTG